MTMLRSSAGIVRCLAVFFLLAAPLLSASSSGLETVATKQQQHVGKAHLRRHGQHQHQHHLGPHPQHPHRGGGHDHHQHHDVALLALGISSAQKDKNATSAEVNATTAEEEDDSSESSDDADDEDDDADQQTPKEQEIAAQAEAEALVLQAKAQDAEKRARDKARMSREARELRRQKIFDAEEKLQANLHEQEEIDARLIDLHNTGAFERRIDRNVRVVANETQAKGLAEMLGSMYKEMWKFGAPALSDELEERAHELKYREPSLQALLADAKKRPGDHKDKPVEKPVVEQATLAPNRVKTEAVSSSNIPKFTAATMPAVSPAMRCVMLLTAQFFIISTLAQIASTMDDYARDDRFNTLQQMSEAAIKTVAYAPMLAVLFAATRVRAIQLSQGDTEKHQLPQPWVQTMMYCCTAGVLGQLVMVIILPIFTGTFEVRTTPDGRIETIPQNLKPIPAKILAILRYVLLALLYGGIGAVCVGLCIMEGPPRYTALAREPGRSLHNHPHGHLLPRLPTLGAPEHLRGVPAGLGVRSEDPEVLRPSAELRKFRADDCCTLHWSPRPGAAD